MKLIYSHDRAAKRIINAGPTSTARVAELCAEFWLYKGVHTAMEKRHRIMAGHSVKTPKGRWIRVEQ